jgi:Na+/H+-dicarboxylate symporter
MINYSLRKTLGYWFNLQPWIKILVGLGLGIIVGLVLNHYHISGNFFRPLGHMFINAIMMMVVPVVFVSLVCGIITMNDPAKLGRVGIKTLLIYFITMALATSLALVLSLAFHPGQGVSTEFHVAASNALSHKTPDFVNILTNIVPKNAISAFAQANVLQIIVFAIILGFAVNLAGEKGKLVARFFESLQHVVYKLVSIIMAFAPYGVFCLIAYITSTESLKILLGLLMVVFLMYLSCILYMLIVYGVGLRFVARVSPIPFYKKMLEAQTVAFSTTSSAATLPVAMRVAQTKLGVSKSISSFIQPLGATINMNGLSIYLGIVAIFAADLAGVHLSVAQMTVIVLTATLAAIGAAGVPGAALVVMSLVLSAVGLPLGVIAIIAAIDRVMDMMSTTTNITGDAFTAVLVAKSEGELDQSVYYTRQHVELSPEPVENKVDIAKS